MIPTKHTLRRPEQPIQIGPRHGYRIEGDYAFINAELHVPPYADASAWSLELWATEQPYGQGPLTGSKVAGIALELPTPIGPIVHHVDTRTSARLPIQGREHAMTLALIEHGPDGRQSVHAFANYPASQTFVAPHFEGSVGYRLQDREVVLEADGIFNPRPETNLSGSLSVELWAFPVGGSTPDGLRLAAFALEPIAGQARLPALEQRVFFSEPPLGQHRLALLLCEWTVADGYVARDRRDFACVYESAGEVAPSVEVTPTSARPVERLRLVPGVEAEAVKGKPIESNAVATPVDAKPVDAKPVIAQPAGSKASNPLAGMVSIQTASVDELAAVAGLSLKLAKEIIKARPFTSLADLIRVRGIGEKTIVRLKGLLTL